jgi:hypothetical protein
LHVDQEQRGVRGVDELVEVGEDFFSVDVDQRDSISCEVRTPADG